MPFVHIRIAGSPLSSNQTQALQAGATTLMADIMRKKAELTTVLVEQPEVGGWSIGGVPVSLAAHLEVKVTAGTNTKDEKARFVEQAHRLLGQVLGKTLPVATYVVIDEIVPDAWGYDGRTQASRKKAADSVVTQPERSRMNDLSAIAAVMGDAMRLLTFQPLRRLNRDEAGEIARQRNGHPACTTEWVAETAAGAALGSPFATAR